MENVNFSQFATDAMQCKIQLRNNLKNKTNITRSEESADWCSTVVSNRVLHPYVGSSFTN